MIPCKRKCWDCGNVAMHDDNITPHVLCKKCGSQDTRLVKGTQAMSYRVKLTQVTTSVMECVVHYAIDAEDAMALAVENPLGYATTDPEIIYVDTFPEIIEEPQQ